MSFLENMITEDNEHFEDNTTDGNEHLKDNTTDAVMDFEDRRAEVLSDDVDRHVEVAPSLGEKIVALGTELYDRVAGYPEVGAERQTVQVDGYTFSVYNSSHVSKSLRVDNSAGDRLHIAFEVRDGYSLYVNDQEVIGYFSPGRYEGDSEYQTTGPASEAALQLFAEKLEQILEIFPEYNDPALETMRNF